MGDVYTTTVCPFLYFCIFNDDMYLVYFVLVLSGWLEVIKDEKYHSVLPTPSPLTTWRRRDWMN